MLHNIHVTAEGNIAGVVWLSICGCGLAQYLWVWFGSVSVSVVRLSICGCGLAQYL